METVHWDVDRRRATLFTRMYMFGMRAARDKQSFEGAQQTLKTAHERQDHRMFHVWMTRAIPERRRTRRQLVRIVHQRATAAKSAAK